MNKNDKNQWRFQALDTLFFRESRPMNAIGGALLSSNFPPPARTIIGAIRTTLKQALNIDLKASHKDFGDSETLGKLEFNGPFLLKNGKRLFPAPLVVLKAGEEKTTEFTRLIPSTTLTQCDLGTVKLPNKKNKELKGAKPLEKTWLTEEGFLAVLKGDTPKATDVVEAKDLFHAEERLGIGRDFATRTSAQGLLYSTEHVRPATDVSIGIHVQGLSDMPDIPEEGLLRLGAEGRMAHWKRTDGCKLPVLPSEIKKDSKKVMLVLLTHANFVKGWLPDGFVETTVEKQTVWEGTLNGVKLRIICSVIGKPIREGGWDLANNKPRPVETFVPAGSCYFCEVLEGNAANLHSQKIGRFTGYGRGEIAVGVWK